MACISGKVSFLAVALQREWQQKVIIFSPKGPPHTTRVSCTLLQKQELSFYSFFFYYRLTILLIVAIGQVPVLNVAETCHREFLQLLIGFLVIWLLATVVEIALIVVSFRGTILEDELRWHSEYLLYIRLGKVFLAFMDTSLINFIFRSVITKEDCFFFLFCTFHSRCKLTTQRHITLHTRKGICDHNKT